MTEPFKNAPELGKNFVAAQAEGDRERRPEIDAEHWEPADEREDDTPEELRHDPPRKVWVAERVYEPTPFGTVERNVQQELDPATRRAMHEAQERPRDIDDDFADLRSIDEAGAGAEYEEFVRAEEPWHENYENRIRERFNRMKEREPDREL